LGDGFTLTLASDLAEISRLTERLARFGREHAVPERAVQHMTLALDELITNVVEHGGHKAQNPPTAAEQMVNVHLWLEPGWLHAELVDAGQAFDPFAQAVQPDIAAELDQRPIGGLGVHFVRTLIDRTDYQRSGNHNVIRLAKSLSSE
jgi:anti-sigma regulatory factor (Ser/Thr protein kinase)